MFSYLVLFHAPAPLDQLYGLNQLLGPGIPGIHQMVLWVGKHVLRVHREIPTAFTGSGDRTFDYVLLFCVFVLAVLVTLIWSILDRRSNEYNRLAGWLYIYVRYVLVCSMFVYGLSKVIKLQFQFPPSHWLVETYGEASPMRLLWAFMGYSTPYTVFSGAAETLGAILLCFRRTTLLGALVLTPVLTNVALLNFCYDVPVKIYSAHLLLSAIYLVGPDLRHLADALVLNRPTRRLESRSALPLWQERGAKVFKLLFLGWFLFFLVRADLNNYR